MSSQDVDLTRLLNEQKLQDLLESQTNLPKAQDSKVVSRTIIVQSPEDEAEVERLMSEI